MSELAALHDAIWRALESGVNPGRSPFSMVYLATIGGVGAPKLRTVVLRRVNAAARTIGFNTDLRSPKVAEISAEPRVSVLAYDQEGGVQIRMEGMATLHRQGGAHREAWRQSAPGSRICYRHAFAPGAALENPADADPTPEMREPDDPDRGLRNFCAVEIELARIERLELASEGHRRAVFSAARNWRGRWIAP